MAFSLFSLSNDLFQYEIFGKYFWSVPSERYVVYSFAFVNHAARALVLDLFKIWNPDEDLNSWTLFKALIKGRNYELLKDVFCSFDAYFSTVLIKLGVKVSPFTEKAHLFTKFQLRPFAYFRFDWEKLKARATKRLPELLDMVMQADDKDLLAELDTHLGFGMQSDSMFQVLLRGNHPKLFKHFLIGSKQTSSDAREAILRSEYSEMWEVALSSIPLHQAFQYACENDRFQTLTYLCSKAYNFQYEELVALGLQTNDISVFAHVWNCCGNRWDHFFNAWKALDFMDLSPSILQKVAESFGCIEGVENYSVVRKIMSSTRFLPLVKYLSDDIVKLLATSVVTAKMRDEEHGYFEALLNLGQENVTRRLFDQVIDSGAVSLFLYAQDKFGGIEITEKHIIMALLNGRVEIVASLLPRGPLNAKILQVANQILEEKEALEAHETARLVLADKRCVNFL